MQVRTINSKQTPFAAERAKAAPSDSPARGVNFPLIYFLAIPTDYPDKKFAYEFSKEPPILGEIAQCHAITTKPRDASISLGQRRRGLPARNNKIVQQLQAKAGSEIAPQ